MGFKDLLKKKELESVPQPQPITSDTYSRNWLSKQVIANSLEPSDDMVKVDKILEALNRKNGQCPCGGNGSQFKCPCVRIRIHGICTCGLFKSAPPKNISGSTVSAKIVPNDKE